MTRKLPHSLPYILTITLALALVAGFVLTRPYEFHGAVIAPALPVTDFTLQTANGKLFRLSGEKGKIILLFFGYTNCPDVCPTTLATFKQVYEKLGNHAQKVRFVMVTADPERDTPEKVAAYAALFNPEFIGVSGSLADLQPIWKELGVFVEKQNSGSQVGYLVSHTASVYVINQNGNLLMTFPYGTNAVDMTDDLIQLLKQAQSK